MKKSYTQQDIEKILGDFRSLRNPYNIEKVHQLLNNPDAKARHSVKLNSKPFNFIIMTSVIVIGLSALLFWSGPEKADVEPEAYKIHDAGDGVFYDSVVPKIKASDQTMEKAPGMKAANSPKPGISPKVSINSGIFAGSLNFLKDSNPVTQTAAKQEIPLITLIKNDKDTILRINSETCAWPGDTIIDKHLLLLDLTDGELHNIGIARKGSAMYYHNIIEGKYDWASWNNPDLIPVEDRITTHNKFFVAYRTNSNFEPAGTGDFYSSMDTLVPVIINRSTGNIFWFTPEENFFTLLPERYNYLSEIYKNLVCLKKKYPARSFTNYLESGKERILDPVNVLSLAKADLQKIGIIIDEGSVLFQTKNKNYSLKICESGTYSAGNSDDSDIFPPNPYPVAMTDTLGRQVYMQGTHFRKDSVTRILNILVPVRVNIHDFVKSYKEVIICWYYPTDDFLKALPGNMGTDLKSEMLGVTNSIKGSSSSCKYYEACKSSLKLENFKLYPNPANNSVTIEFQNSEELTGSISIVNMAGLKLRELLPNTPFLTGHNSYSMDLSGISSGIYLISVNSPKGFKTQRLIISR